MGGPPSGAPSRSMPARWRARPRPLPSCGERRGGSARGSEQRTATFKRPPQFPGLTARCGRVSEATGDVLTIPAASFSLLLLASLMIPTGARAAPRPLRIVTINLLHGGMTSELTGRGQHLEERLTMVVRELRTLDADVVGVQEASRGRRRGDVAARLASALGFQHVYAPAAPRWPLVSRVLGLEEGPAVLSRFPIVTSHAHPIDGCGGLYRRVLVCAELATPRGPLEACSTHLDGSDCHAERVASILGARPRTAPLLLMGDLNATEQSKGIRNLIAALGLVDTFREANPAAPGFTVWQPVWLERPFASRRVDFILLAPGANTRARVVASRVVLNQPSRTQGRVLWPSDHYGVLSEVEILRRAGDGKARAGRARARAARRSAAVHSTRFPWTPVWANEAGRPEGIGDESRERWPGVALRDEHARACRAADRLHLDR